MAQQQGSDNGADPWVRCVCGNGLWRRYEDHIEMIISPRGRERRTISAPIEGASGIKVVCEKCGHVWTAGPDLRLTSA